jgi:UDP-N-acetylmuramoyl-tripeptide--D-alanyl-D-alanine ligase
VKTVTAGWIADAVGGKLSGDAGIEVTAVVRDSREVTPGALYVALPGERVDGHDFVDAAFAAGAVLHLVSRPVAAPHVLVSDATVALGALAREYLRLLRGEGDITVIGVTGSVGKTTTKDLLTQILPDCVAPIGSYNNEIGLPLTVLRADDATRNLILEMGASGVGHISYLTDIAPPDIVVVLVVGTAHLGEYTSIDEVTRAKAEIVEGRANGATVLLNADDPRVAAMARIAPEARTFGVGSGDVRATGVRMEGGRACFTLSAEGDSAEVRLRLVGEHHVTNALAAAAVAWSVGMGIAKVAEGLNAAMALSPHRMAVTTRADGVTILDDSYNASPESMAAAFRALGEIATEGRSVAVIGEMREMGDASPAAHDELGCLAVRLGIDRLVVVGEGARAAYDAAVREGFSEDEATYVATVDEARRFLDTLLATGDTVLVKSSRDSGLWRLADSLLGGTP